MRTFLIAFAVSLLAACGSSKPSPERMPAPLLEFKPAMAIRTAWTIEVGRADAYIFTPAAVNGSIYAAAANGMVLRAAADSGQTLWRVNANMPLTAGVGADGQTVAVAGREGMLVAFDNDGKQRWKVQASSEILSAPAVGQGMVVVRSMDNKIAAYDALTGTRRWIVERSMPALSLRAAPGIVIAGSRVYAGLPGGRLLALDLNNGAPVWEVAVSNPRGSNDLERIADVAGFPVIDGNQVCAVAYQGNIGCVNAMTGAALWARPFSGAAGLGADQRFVFAADEAGVVQAFGRHNGSPVWSNGKLVNRKLSAPVSFGRAIVIGDGYGYVHFLSREDGSMLARAAIDKSPIVAAPLVVGNSVIFQTKAGTLVALTTE